jgi:hypothetical protein
MDIIMLLVIASTILNVHMINMPNKTMKLMYSNVLIIQIAMKKTTGLILILKNVLKSGVMIIVNSL